LHGAVLGGLGTLGLVAAGWTALWLVGAAKPLSSARDVRLLWITIAACVFALFVTPYGYGSLEAWLAIMKMSLPDLIIEHAPLDPRSPQGLLAILVCLVYIAVFASTPRAWWRPTYWLPLVWFVLTCQRIRHAPLFAVGAGIAMADLLPQSLLAPWLVRRRWLRAVSETSPKERRIVSMRFAVIVLIMTAPLFVAATWRKQVATLPFIGAGWARPPARVWPESLIESLTSYAAENRDGTPVFNEPILGGFLIYQYPTLRVFIDGRCELYGEPFLRDFVTAWRDPSRVGKWQGEFGFRAAIIEAGSPLRSYFDNHDQWRLVAEAPAARFYRREEN
jgi:hypothetical protein